MQENTHDELWKATLMTERLLGERMRRAILPIFEQWLDREHGNMGYYLTQIMSRHGSFAECTYRIRKTADEQCRMCGAERDTVEHTIAECPKWEIWREELIRNVSGTTED